MKPNTETTVKQDLPINFNKDTPYEKPPISTKVPEPKEVNNNWDIDKLKQGLTEDILLETATIHSISHVLEPRNSIIYPKKNKYTLENNIESIPMAEETDLQTFSIDEKNPF